MDNQPKPFPLTYTQAGFNGFLRRSIDSHTASTLREASSELRMSNIQAINFDHQPATGHLGSVIQVGDGVTIDGVNRRISVFDENSTEVVRIGRRDG